MKKLFVFLIVSVIMLNSFGFCTVYADNDETRAVLAMVKGRIPDTSEYEDLDSSVEDYAGSLLYSFGWTSYKDDDFKSINLTTTSDGIITSYNISDNSDDIRGRLTVNKKSSAEVMPDAQKLVYELNPDLEGKLLFSNHTIYENISDSGYSYSIQRIENGIPVFGDNGYVIVNSDCTSVRSFHLTYTHNLDFSSPSQMISTDKAKEIYTSEFGMELVYSSSYSDEEDTASLCYVDKTDGSFVDATDGSLCKPYSVHHYSYGGSLKNEAAQDSVAAGGFTPAELEEIENVEGLMSVSEIDSVIRQNKYIKISDNMTMKVRYRYQNTDDEYVYSIDYNSPDYNYVSVIVNAHTGAIISLYQSPKDSVDSSSVPESLAKEAAAYFAPDLYSQDDTGEYRLSKSEGNGNFTFVRYINNIPYYENTIRLCINPKDNSLISYSQNHDKTMKFPYPDSVLTSDEACAKLFEQVDYSPMYYPCASTEDQYYNDSMKLLYITDPSADCILDAKSGKLLKQFGEGRVGDYTDISGHYAENIIKTLAKFGIGFEENEFCPDTTITQKDFVALLSLIMTGNSDIILGKNYSYNHVYSLNIVKPEEKNPDAPLTRETACIYMIRALDLEMAAELDGIYITQFDDVTKNVGYISILSAMGIVNGYNGIFNPDQSLSRADAMIMLYNYLK